MTERLYYADTYLVEFDAVVLACERAKDNYRVRLDKSAFYPTGGGQPHDVGTLGGARVNDVVADDAGDVCHITDAPLAIGERVNGKIDWARRFDHMQQHAGEHMLASAVYRHFSGHTIGLHLGADASTIDVVLPSGLTRVPDKEIFALEDDANALIQSDARIRCWFPDADELKALPLRKAPAVGEHVRVVNIGEYEYCACGGTHPSSAGQVGLIKVLDARPSRGKLRLTFVCGKRAFEDYRRRFTACERAAELLSTGYKNLPDAVSALDERARGAEYLLNRYKRDMALKQAPDIIARAIDLCGARVTAHVFEDIGIQALRDVANHIVDEGNFLALLADEAPAGCALVYARSKDVDIDVNALMKLSAGACFGKGGGRPDFAQGEAASAYALSVALEQLTQGRVT